ncbi:MAG: hypothetical protein JWN76_2183 [Chitinophagaceae bacterium]|nr:hypothetical protein [Chitinophagaceae bacterium]
MMFWLKGFLALALITVFSSWGFLVHRTINQLAIYQLPAEIQKFFFKNQEYLVYNAPRPDTRRNSDKTEAPRHFIDAERYGDSALWKMSYAWAGAVKKYSADSLYKYGYVPYVIMDVEASLTRALKNKNKDSILFYAADLGHYIGDANVPLHTTENYDGQLSNQKGLHSLWESMIPELEINNYMLYTDHKATYLKKPEAAIWSAVRVANALLPQMLAKEKEVSRNFTEDTKFRIQMRNGRESKSYSTAFARAYAESLKNTINQQLLNSTNLIADFWYTAWINAGKPDLSSITEWTNKEDAEWKTTFDVYKNNKLIEQDLLLARKGNASGD